MECNNCKMYLDSSYENCPNCGYNLNNQKINNLINKKNFSILKYGMVIILIIIFISFIYYLIVDTNNNLNGTWKCTDYNGNYSDSNYYFEIILDNNGSFIEKSITSINGNININGTYTIKEVKSIYEGVNKTYDIDLKSNNQINKYQFRLIDDNKSLVINTNNYMTYLCRKY